jgi:hypothetical protein
MSTRLARLAARLEALSGSAALAGNSLQVSRRGNDLAIPLPAVVVQALGLREGDVFDIRALDSGTLTIVVCRAISHAS